jgi:protein-L-isoaspartate(D-aspartate) O-methyltransferase
MDALGGRPRHPFDFGHGLRSCVVRLLPDGSLSVATGLGHGENDAQMETRGDRSSPGTQLRRLLEQRGISDARVLSAIEETPRERFVDRALRSVAYDDRALSITSGQTISQPFVVARMTELLELTGAEDERVLEIGTGSGYQTAILAKLTHQIVSVERLGLLSEQAQRVLGSLGIRNVEFHVGDGSMGWPDAAAYDAIIVTAAAPKVSDVLYQQLKIGGRLVIPVGSEANQVLQRIVRETEGPVVSDDFQCRFVPLIGQEAWARRADEGH